VQDRLLALLASAEASLAKSTSPSTKNKKEAGSGTGSSLTLFDDKNDLEELLPMVQK